MMGWVYYPDHCCYYCSTDKASRKAYCSRCKRKFSSRQALQQYYDDFASHYRCEVCGFDGSTWEESLEHFRTTKHRVVCQGCDDGEGMIWVPRSQEYLDHLKEQNVCKTCQMHFESTSNLDNVSQGLFSRKLCLTPALASNGAFGTID